MLKEIILVKLLESGNLVIILNMGLKWDGCPLIQVFSKRKCYVILDYMLDLGSSADYELMLRMFEVHVIFLIYPLILLR